jgi:hypothetical protein
LLFLVYAAEEADVTGDAQKLLGEMDNDVDKAQGLLKSETDRAEEVR